MEYSILLVEDEEAFHELIPDFFALDEKHTFTVHSAINGKAGVDEYSKLANEGQKPDLVLIDLRMPMMNGVEATKRIIEKDPKANIYLFTAYAGTGEERDAIEAGAKGTINKGTDWHSTLEEIVTILESVE